MTTSVILLAFACLILVVGITTVFAASRRRGRWGINFVRVQCPSCGHPLPKSRQPATARQTLWGGWTCSICLSEVNKWGKQMPLLESGGLAEPSGQGPAGESPHSFLQRQFKNLSTFQKWLTIFFVAVDIAYDVFSPRAVVFDLIAVCAFLVWFYRRRGTSQRR